MAPPASIAARIPVSNGDEQGRRRSKDHSIGIQNPRLSPVFPSLAAAHPALQPNRRAARHRAQVFHLHLASHRRHSSRTIGLAHRLVQQGRDDAAMQITGRSFILVCHRCVRDHRPRSGFSANHRERQAKPHRVPGSAAEAVILSAVKQRRRFRIRQRGVLMRVVFLRTVGQLHLFSLR